MRRRNKNGVDALLWYLKQGINIISGCVGGRGARHCNPPGRAMRKQYPGNGEPLVWRLIFQFAIHGPPWIKARLLF